MQGWRSVGAWVQQNVWILHKPKEGGKKHWYLDTRIPTFFSVSPDENGFGSAACLGLCVSASVCVIIARCVSAVVCGFRSAWAWQLGSRQNPGDLNPTCCLTLSADGGSRETAISHHKGQSLVTSPSFARTLPCNCSLKRGNVKVSEKCLLKGISWHRSLEVVKQNLMYDPRSAGHFDFRTSLKKYLYPKIFIVFSICKDWHTHRALWMTCTQNNAGLVSYKFWVKYGQTQWLGYHLFKVGIKLKLDVYQYSWPVSVNLKPFLC